MGDRAPTSLSRREFLKIPGVAGAAIGAAGGLLGLGGLPGPGAACSPEPLP